MLVFRSKQPSHTAEFVKNNAPDDAYGTPGDMWRKYLSKNGGTGETFYDLEAGWIRAQGYSTLDALIKGAGIVYSTIKEGLRRYLGQVFTFSSSYYIQEDGTSRYVLEDGSGNYILE